MTMVEDPIVEIAARNLFFVKDVVERSEAKTSDKFDIYDPQSRKLLLEVREPDLGVLTKAARLMGKHPITGIGADAKAPFNYVVSTPEGPKVLRIVKGSSSFRVAQIKFFDGADNTICSLEKIAFCIGRKYRGMGPAGGSMFTLRVKAGFTQIVLLVDEKEAARVTSNWKGDHADFYKEGFKYAFSISPDMPNDGFMRNFLLALGLSYKRALEG